jgi:hypothetical protein
MWKWNESEVQLIVSTMTMSIVSTQPELIIPKSGPTVTGVSVEGITCELIHSILRCANTSYIYYVKVGYIWGAINSLNHDNEHCFHSARSNLSKIWAHSHQCNRVRQHSWANPHHPKVLKHFKYMLPESGMSLRYYQWSQPWRSASFPLSQTQPFQNLGPPSPVDQCKAALMSLTTAS